MDTNASDVKDTAFPLFYMEPVELIAQSKAEGRPVFRETEFVKVMLPGFKDISVHKVRPEDIERWPEYYRKFKEGNNTETIIGTPIKEWNGIRPSQAAACKTLNVLSVEALASLPDQALRKLGPDCYELQKRARDFLSSANSSSRITELEKKLEEALNTIETLKVSPQVEPIKAESKEITGPDGKTWSGKGRKPNWVKEMEGK